MNRSQKEASVLDVRDKIEKSKGCFVFEYHGLKAEDINGLRRQFKKDKGELKVFKNTLVRRALKGSESEKLLMEAFEGPVACVFSYQDVVTTAKTLVEFEKDEKSLNIKAGILDHKKLTLQEIKKLAKLPARETLLGQFVGTLAAPLRAFVTVLSAVPRDFIAVLKAIEQKKK